MGDSQQPGSIIGRYLAATATERLDPGALAFYASLDAVSAVSPQVAGSIAAELADQRSNVKLIASENYS